MGNESPAKPDKNGIVAAANDLGEAQPLEPALIRAAFTVIPGNLIVQTLLDVFFR